MTTSGVGETNDDNNNEKVPVPVRGSDDNNQSEGDQNSNPTAQKSQVMESEKNGRGAGSSNKAMRKKSDSRPRSAPVFDGPEVPPPCEVCGKVFPSWKSLFGHMRSHPERSWRGVKPPPIFTPPASPKGDEDGALAVTLLQIGESPIAPDHALTDHNKVASPISDPINESGSSMSRGALAVDFDLNDPMEEEEAPPSPKRQKTFDLNMPAPENDDEEAVN